LLLKHIVNLEEENKLEEPELKEEETNLSEFSQQVRENPDFPILKLALSE